MKEWCHWSPNQGNETSGFAVVGIGRFGITTVTLALTAGAAPQRAADALEASLNSVDELRRWTLSRNSCQFKGLRPTRRPSKLQKNVKVNHQKLFIFEGFSSNGL